MSQSVWFIEEGLQNSKARFLVYEKKLAKHLLLGIFFLSEMFAILREMLRNLILSENKHRRSFC